MKRKYDFPYKEVFYSIIGWLVLMYFFYFVSVYGFISAIKNKVIYDYLVSWESHIELMLSGILMGILFALINIASERTRLRGKSFGYIIVVKSILYLVALFVVSIIIDLVYILFGIISLETKKELMMFFTSEFLVSFSLYFVVALALANIFVQVSKKFGPGNFSKLIFGKYHTPKEEKRIFMFLDLKGSTGIAERLEHKLYSQFLRNCYHDLTEFIIKYRAQIYQYVGDEVVLSWDVREGIKNLNCIKLFYSYRDFLIKNKDRYLNDYGVVPVFKCGLDMGEVTVSEIGDLKREIAYHGDVLNTASRIQEQCNLFEKEILISEHVADAFTETAPLTKQLVTCLTPRGKKQEVNIFGVELTTK